MSMSSADDVLPNGDSTQDVIHLTIRPRYIALVGSAVTVGACLGIRRGAQKASLQFLAENAHRTPRTVKGWYLYNKTKNYRVMLGAIKAGSWEASRLGVMMLGWVAIEEGIETVGGGDVKEIGAGIGTAALFSVMCNKLAILYYMD